MYDVRRNIAWGVSMCALLLLPSPRVQPSQKYKTLRSSKIWLNSVAQNIAKDEHESKQQKQREEEKQQQDKEWEEGSQGSRSRKARLHKAGTEPTPASPGRRQARGAAS